MASVSGLINNNLAVNTLDGLTTVSTSGGTVDPSLYVKYTGNTSDTDLGAYNITTVRVPTANADLTNKQYVDGQDALRLPYTGATANLTMGAYGITTTALTASGTITASGVTTGTPAVTLGLNASNQVVSYANPAGVFTGSVSAGYVPYASSANNFANSILSQSGTTLSNSGNESITGTLTTIGTVSLDKGAIATAETPLTWTSPYLTATGGNNLISYTYTSGQGFGTSTAGATTFAIPSTGLLVGYNVSYQMVITGFKTSAPSSGSVSFDILQGLPYASSVLLYSSGTLSAPTAATTYIFALNTVANGTDLVLRVNNYAGASSSALVYFNTMSLVQLQVQLQQTNVANSFNVTGPATVSKTLTVAGIINNGSDQINQNLPIPTLPVTGQLPAQINIASSSQNMRIGSYYTSGVGSIGIIQTSDYYSGAEHPDTLALNPIGGNVGMGTTSPIAGLHVAGGTGGTYGNVLIDCPNAGAAGASLVLRNSAAGVNCFSSLLFELDGTTATNPSGTTPIVYNAANGMIYCQNVGTGGSNAAKMGFQLWNGSAETEPMTILPSGYVGIGNTAPIRQLEVVGSTNDYGNGIEHVINNNTTPKTTLAVLAPNMTAGNGNIITIGKDVSFYNALLMSFNYKGAASGNNFLSFAGYGTDNGLSVTVDGRIGMGQYNTSNTYNGYYKLLLTGTNGSSLGPHSEVFTNSDSYPLFQQLNWAHDDVTLSFDSYFDGSWRNSSSTNGWRITKNAGKLYFTCYAASSPGGTSTWYDALVLSLAQATFPYRTQFNGVYSSSAQPYCQIGGNGGGNLSVGTGGVVFGSGTMTAYQSVGMSNILGSGWELANGRFWITNDGRWLININFYFNVFYGGTRLTLQRINSGGSLVESRYCCVVGGGYGSDTTYSYSTEMYCYYGDYLRVVVTSGSGCTYYYAGMDHSHLTFTFLS